MGGALEFHRRLRPPAGALDGSSQPACMGRLLNQPLAGVTVRKLPMSWPSSRSPSIALALARARALARSGRPRLVTPRYGSPVFRFRRHTGWAGRCVPVPPAPTRQAAPQTAHWTGHLPPSRPPLLLPPRIRKRIPPFPAWTLSLGGGVGDAPLLACFCFRFRLAPQSDRGIGGVASDSDHGRQAVLVECRLARFSAFVMPALAAV
jgi:hypothetical protein